MADAFITSELPRLKRRFWFAVAYLTVVVGITLVATVAFAIGDTFEHVWLAVAAGIAGSGTAAMVSCLDRRAHGFEDSEGHQMPATADRVERFNEGMFPWFLVRPWLGAVVAAIVYWGFLAEADLAEPSDVVPDPTRVAFFGLISGLFAKTVLDILRNIPKNIFRM